MRTIKSILEYNLTNSEKNHLYMCWITNGCWWKGWKNFDKILKDNIEFIPWFNKNKADKLYKDIREICFEHDIEFRFKKWFYKSNYRMAKKLYKLLYWAKFSQRFSIVFICFILLSKYWKKFYYTKRK